MRIRAQFALWLVVAVALIGVTWGTPAHAISIVEMRATLAEQVPTDLSGEPPVPDALTIQNSTRLLLGGDASSGGVGSTDPSGGGDPATAGIASTFEATPLGNYAASIVDPDLTLGYLNGTSWWTKLDTFLRIDPSYQYAEDYSIIRRTRTSETHAIMAVAPGSASGFATDADASRGGGNGIRLSLFGYFRGGDYDDGGIGPAPGAPQFFYGDDFADSAVPGADNSGPTFNETLQAFNLGLQIVVDLDAAGVAVGDDYEFYQNFTLGVGPGVYLKDLELAFVDIDPIYGFATVAEPGTIMLFTAAIGLLPLTRVRARRRRAGNKA